MARFRGIQVLGFHTVFLCLPVFIELRRKEGDFIDLLLLFSAVVCCAMTIFFSLFFLLLLLPLAPEQCIPRAGSGLHHQQPSRAAQPGQQTQWDLHTRQQHRPGQTMPVFPLQEEHPEVNKGESLYGMDVFPKRKYRNSFNPGFLWPGCFRFNNNV